MYYIKGNRFFVTLRIYCRLYNAKSEQYSPLSKQLKTIIPIFFLAIFSLLLSTGFISVDAKRPSEKNHTERFIQICCSWGEQLVDGTLTYKINGGQSSLREAVRNAVVQWDSKIAGLNFQEVKGSGSADINIAFKKDGKFLSGQRTKHGIMTAGLTSFELRGHNTINGVHITLARGVRGNDFSNSQLELVAEHELGHALGLGHSNFKSSIMFPTISNQQSVTLSGCEINGVLEANAWKLVDGKDNPYSAKGDTLPC